MRLATFIDDFISLIYPHVCMACGKSLYKYEECICLYCRYHLPRTNFHNEAENPVSKLFWGKAPVHSAAAYYHFQKGGKVQHLIHQLKYKERSEVGIYIGGLYGKDLAASPLFNKADMIIPVPLHPQKQRKRGYNQSEMFADGLAQSMNIPVNSSVLTKTTATETQTRKSRFSRWENVKEVFHLENPAILENKHILLVDDVITTGSTIESCVNMLLRINGVRVSVAAMACASR
jgi:ComF family protein